MTDTLYITDMLYKDDDPMHTVRRIREILKTHNISVTEQWGDSKVPYCYFLRITVDGCSFGVNGKGLTRELALASGYGELMERLQLGHYGSTQAQKTGDFNTTPHPTVAVDAQALYEQNPQLFDRIAVRAGQNTGRKISARDALLAMADKDGRLHALSFTNMTTGAVTPFPRELLTVLYSANGGAAGNTPEEAIVQGISEVVERNHHLRIMDDGLCLPDIPEAELERYPVSFHIISYLREKGLRVLVRDASLGTGFPVVCVIIIDPKTGKYHTHYGAYPVFEIALERALTESFQGRDIEHITEYREFYKPYGEGYDLGRNAIELIWGSYKRSQDFFVGRCDREYDPAVGFSGKDNRELLRQCLNMFKKMGLDVLVLDSSSLGFPTYRVLIPGYSETYAYRFDTGMDDRRYNLHVRRVMSDPCTADIYDFIGISKYMSIRNKFGLDRIGPLGFRKCTGIQLEISKAADSRLANCALGYSCYVLNQISSARKCMEQVLSLGDFPQKAYGSCLYRYLQLSEEKCPPEKMRQILELFHDGAAVEQLYDLLNRGENPFAPLVLRCGPEHCGACPLKDRCNRENVAHLRKLVRSGAHAMDADASRQRLLELIR